MDTVQQPTGHVWAEWQFDALHVVFSNYSRILVPKPFLEALRRGLRETNGRLMLAVDTVLADWQVGKVKPANPISARSYFFGEVRNVLLKLRELETPAVHKPLEAKQSPKQDETPTSEPVGPRVIH